MNDNGSIFLGLMLIALACWHLDEARERYKRKKQRKCQWRHLG